MKQIGIALCLSVVVVAGCSREVDKPPASPPPEAAKPIASIEIVDWSIAYKSEYPSTGAVFADWKFHIRNKTDKQQTGQLWLYGLDEDGFQFYENVYEGLTAIPPNGELKIIHEAFFSPGDFEKAKTFRMVWKPLF